VGGLHIKVQVPRHLSGRRGQEEGIFVDWLSRLSVKVGNKRATKKAPSRCGRGVYSRDHREEHRLGEATTERKGKSSFRGVA